MTALANLQYLRDTELWKSYTPEWREWKIKETPEIEWKFWLKNGTFYESLPAYFSDYFCDAHTSGYWKHSSQFNFRVCNTCGRLPLNCWPLFVFRCDECDELFVARRYPIHYQLCHNCGGDELNATDQ